MKTLLIDGDILAYIASSNSDYAVDWGDGEGAMTVADPDHLKSLVNSTIEAWKADTGCDHHRIAMSSSPYFRHDLFAQYKAHRADSKKPAGLDAAKAYLRSLPHTTVIPKLEADDILGIWASGWGDDDEGQVICSIDKDLLQIPGKHWNPRKGTLTVVTTEEADRFFYIQALSGDPTDGIPGCRGIGPKRAEKIVEEVWSEGPAAVWQTIVHTYRQKFQTADFALLQARLVRILRWDEYDTTKGVKLWSPTTSQAG